MADYLQLLPAVDVLDGRVAPLARATTGPENVVEDPIEAALNWQTQGAEWIHLVDLDAAFGRGENSALLAEIVGRLDVKVQLSGGVRDDKSLHVALSTGCERVNVATEAVASPEWCAQVIAEHGDRLAFGLDLRGHRLSARGRNTDDGDVFDVLDRLDSVGCARYVVTDVDRDGMLAGPNVELLRSIASATDRPLVASGGITTLTDLEALQSLLGIGVEGVIVGTALYERHFALIDALALTRP